MDQDFGPEHPQTRAVRAGHTVDSQTGALAPPLHLSTTFERAPDGSFPHGFSYSRDANPNRTALESALAALEGGVEAAAFASGLAATYALFAALRPGDRVVAPLEAYYGVKAMLDGIFVPWGLEVTYADATDMTALRAAIGARAALVFLETPSNPRLRVTDLQAAAEAAHAAGAVCVCDNTLAPMIQTPFDAGVDLIVHATTKFIAGHHDALGGALVARKTGQYWERIRFGQRIGGAVPSPFGAWLTLRGVASLPLRIEAHSRHALALAQRLAEHPRVERVLYPGLESHEHAALARRQMRAFGGVLSLQVAGGETEAMAVAARTRIFTRATSFGGPHSLIEHRASIEGPQSLTPPNLLRLAVGLEHPDDLYRDLARALEA